MRVLVAVIAGLLLLGLAGAVSQAVATSSDQRTYPPPGEMINVAGHRLHLHCTGYGSPTVILEAGNLGIPTSSPVRPKVRRCFGEPPDWVLSFHG